MAGGQLEALCLVLPGIVPYVFPLLADSNPYPLAVIIYNHEYNSFQGVLQVRLANYQT